MNKKMYIFSSGLAIFSMLFGAGNVVYPLVSGQYAGGNYLFAILGFLTSSVIFAFIGTLSMMLYEGDYTSFFSKIGKWPGFILTVFIMCLIGPFGAMPRILTVAHASIKNIVDVNIFTFSILSCVLIFLCTFKKKKILDVLGYFLTPLLLISLFVIIIVGFFKMQVMPKSEYSKLTVLSKSFFDGNQTMDLFATLIFSSMVFNILKLKFENIKNDSKKILNISLKASFIGLSILAVVYICFIKLSAIFSVELANLSGADILRTLAVITLGSKASYITSIAIGLACITTAIALLDVFSEFLHEKIFFKKINNNFLLIGSLVITSIFSSLNFSTITSILGPILAVVYPALVVLSIVNIANKLYNFKYIKLPVFATFIATAIFKIYS